MVITFVSNYINHHQLPFCRAMDALEDVEFHFIQTSPMEEKRLKMGWGVDTGEFSFVSLFYEEKEKCTDLILNSDVTILGWSDGVIADIEEKRLSSGKLTFRMSERIYREGQWKAISPKGLVNKYREHIRYRRNPVYLLCTGAYVASDFALIHSYPGKMLKWGYFPNVEASRDDQNVVDGSANELGESHNSNLEFASAVRDKNSLRMLWAGRLITLKHPEYAVEAARVLKEKGYSFTLEIIGDGEKRPELEELISKYDIGSFVKLYGSKKPSLVAEYMKQADIFLFTSNYLEGWGAVVNEAMQSGCAVVASKEAGAVPFLIEDGVNGLTYEGGSLEDFVEKVCVLFEHKHMDAELAQNARKTINTLWNADNAARELFRFSAEFLAGNKNPRPSAKGPMSRAEVIKAPGFIRTLQEKNRLE